MPIWLLLQRARQELQEEHGGQETGVRVVFEREAEEFSE